MGHDISAYLGSADPADPLEYPGGWNELPEIAYLRRGAYNPLRHALYEVLDAQEYDGNVSGDGRARWFSRGQLSAALQQLFQRLASGHEIQPEIDFVRQCLAALPPDRTSVVIWFG